MVFGDALITSTVGTQLLTVGQMNVEVNCSADGQTIFGFLEPLLGSGWGGLPVRNHWIAGIARSGNVVFIEKFCHLSVLGSDKSSGWFKWEW